MPVFTWPCQQGFDIGNVGWIHGLEIVAVAIVAQAVFSIGQKLIPDRTRATLAILAMSLTLIWRTPWSLTPIDFVLAVVLFGMLVFWKLPPWMIVIAGALCGALIL